MLLSEKQDWEKEIETLSMQERIRRLENRVYEADKKVPLINYEHAFQRVSNELDYHKRERMANELIKSWETFDLNTRFKLQKELSDAIALAKGRAKVQEMSNNNA